ncbi:hypothetical protein Tco_0319401 [Tanacetum coccineum]
MANLEFCDKDDMVSYLKKPTESEGFQEIVYFLNGSHIRSKLEYKFQDLVNSEDIFSFGSALEDFICVVFVPDRNIFPSMLAIQAEEGKGLGHPSEPQPPPSPTQPTNEEPIPNVTSEPIHNVPDKAVYEEWDNRVERATTTIASLDVEQASGNINRTQSTAIPNVPLPYEVGAGGSLRVHTLGSDEGSMTLQELMILCTTLSKKVESLEADLKQTKKVYGAAYTKLIKKVKKLEKPVKSNQARRRAKVVVSDDEEDLEDSSKQGRMIEEIDQDT